MCFVYSGFREFKFKQNDMMKSFLFYENQDDVQILLYNFTWATFRSFYKKPLKLLHAEFNQTL